MQDFLSIARGCTTPVEHEKFCKDKFRNSDTLPCEKHVRQFDSWLYSTKLIIHNKLNITKLQN